MTVSCLSATALRFANKGLANTGCENATSFPNKMGSKNLFLDPNSSWGFLGLMAAACFHPANEKKKGNGGTLSTLCAQCNYLTIMSAVACVARGTKY